MPVKRKEAAAMPEPTPKIRPHISWMIRRDMPEVMDIEYLGFAHPWSEVDFANVLRDGNVIGLVAEHNELIVGFTIYRLFRKNLELLSLAVLPSMQRRGIGTAMLNLLKSKLSPGRRTRIITYVSDLNLDAHLFFAAEGFRALNVMRDYYDHVDDDAYQFVYRHRKGGDG